MGSYADDVFLFTDLRWDQHVDARGALAVPSGRRRRPGRVLRFTPRESHGPGAGDQRVEGAQRAAGAAVRRPRRVSAHGAAARRR